MDESSLKKGAALLCETVIAGAAALVKAAARLYRRPPTAPATAGSSIYKGYPAPASSSSGLRILWVFSAICKKSSYTPEVIESKLLSYCDCADENTPDCDFSKLGRKNLRSLVDLLRVSRLECVWQSSSFEPKFKKLNKLSPEASKEFIASANIAGVFSKSSAISNEALHSKTLSKLPECELDGAGCRSKSLGIEFLFPTTVLVASLIKDSQGKMYNQQLKEIMLNLEEENDGCKFNLHGGYRSKDGFLNRNEPAIQWLKSQILPQINKLLGLTDSLHIPYKVEGWGAVLRSGHGQTRHVHPASMFAGVYYVTAPREVATSGKSDGCLVFGDPRNGASMAQVVRGKNIYGSSFEICPEYEGGLLVIFPSWLEHEVRPMLNSTVGPRIAISFNAVYAP
eukprot:gene6543-8990_t